MHKISISKRATKGFQVLKMKKGNIPIFLLIPFLLWFSTVGFSQELEPEEPDIVLPSVILEIEDLSVESVTSGLPEEEDLLPPEPGIPLPEADELEVREPQLDLTLPQSGMQGAQLTEGQYLTAEAVLGTGTLNEFFGRISLYFLGERPEGKIVYQHETLDGFSRKAPGSGYNLREDRLESELNFDLGRFEMGLQGAFFDLERGLQGNGNFYSKINRIIDTGFVTEFQAKHWLLLNGAVEASAANQLLTAGASGSEEVIEYSIAPSLGIEFQFARGVFGITPGFNYRYVQDDSGLTIWRSRVKGYFGVDISDKYRLDGSVAWFWTEEPIPWLSSEESNHLFPFDLTLQALISDFLTLRLGGGYKVIEYNLEDIFKEYPLGGSPAILKDNSGWFFDVRSNWLPFQGWIVDAGLMFMDNNSIPNFEEEENSSTGLFPFFQDDMQRLTVDVGVRWIISDSFSARAGFEAEILDKPEFYPANRITLDFDTVEKRGKYGGGASVDFTAGVNDFLQVPLFDINGFYRINDYIRLVAEAEDLLYPLLDEPRYSWYPYVDPGLNFKVKVHINF